MRSTGNPSRALGTGAFCVGLLALAVVVLATPQAALAAVYDLQAGTIAQPGSLNSLLTCQPGDTFILHTTATNRVYGRIYTGTDWNGKGGTAAAWVTIKGADGEARPLIRYTGGMNTFEMPSVSYMKFQNIEISGGSETFKFSGTCKYITLDGVYMHGVSDGCVNASGVVEISNLIVRNCEIAGTPGEAFYLGGHEKTYQPQVHDSLIEHNYIHDCHEGVEIKAGCTNITVRDNVITSGTGYPAMTIYGTYKTDNNLRYRIYRNFIFNSSDSAIQCTSDSEITNNVIVSSQSNGISIRSRNLDGKMQNITIANNTFYGAGDTCLQVSNGDIATNVVIANNAIYQTSMAGLAFNAPQGIAGVVLASNLYYGDTNTVAPGLILGAAPASIFLNASTTLAQMDVYPAVGSPLIDAADAAYVAPGDPSLDFNVVARPQGDAPDIGAYEAIRSVNPGWKIAAGFKTVGVPGDADLDGHVDVVDLLTLVYSFGLGAGEPGFDPTADFNKDSAVDVVDLLLLVDNFGF
jgi:hypothetical protein